MLSIITPVLNGARYLEGCLRSVQSLQIPYEHIVVDGGSSDGSQDIVRSLNVRLLHQTDSKGLYSAINQGIAASTGEIVTWVNSDDRVIPNGYKKMYNTIISSSYQIIYSNGYFLDDAEKQNDFMPGVPFARFFLAKGIMPFMQPASMFKRESFDMLGGINSERFRIAGDLDFFHRAMVRKDIKICFVNCCSALFVRHGSNLTGKNNKKAIWEETKKLDCLAGPGTRLFYSGILRYSSIMRRLQLALG